MPNTPCALVEDNCGKSCAQLGDLSTVSKNLAYSVGITVGNFEHFFSTASPTVPTAILADPPLFLGYFSTSSTPPIKNEYKVYE